MSNIGYTLQSTTAKVSLPDPYRCRPGDTYTIDYKNAGQIVRTAVFTCVAYEEEGETKHRWVQQ